MAATSDVEIVPQAVGASPAMPSCSSASARRPLRRCRANGCKACNAIRASRVSAGTAGARVEVVTLQSLIERYGEPAFVKVDIEGFEAAVLAGLNVPGARAVVRVCAGHAGDRARVYRSAHGTRSLSLQLVAG